MLRIVVYGTPAPQGSKKFVGMHGGRATMIESSKKVKPWRQDVMEAARMAMRSADVGGRPLMLDEPLVLRMVFTLPKPQSAPKRRQTWPMRTPDLSKLARSTEDALTVAGVWADDARVVAYDRLAKVYPGEDEQHEALDSPGCIILVMTIDEAKDARIPF